MDIIGIIGLILALIGIVPVITSWFDKNKKRPGLTVELRKRSDSKSINSRSSHPYNDSITRYEKEDNMYVIDGLKAWYRFDHTINMYLCIRNSSEYTAYFPKIHYLTNEKFTYIDELNTNRAIRSGEEIILNCEYSFSEDCHPSKALKISTITIPEQLKNMRILLEYQDSSNRKFYTEYLEAEKKYRFLNNIP